MDTGDVLKAIKTLINLSDITNDSGPTGLIEGTCKALPGKCFLGKYFIQSRLTMILRGQVIMTKGHLII